MVPEAQLRFETLAEDAAVWLRMLNGDSRFSGVVVAGHSEGALLGLLAMHQVPVSGYVSLEGAARSAAAVLHDQLAQRLPAPLMTVSDSILARLQGGLTTDTTPPVLASLFRASVQPYLISWFKYSGSTELARIGVPCLIVQGGRDLQVAPAEADLLHEANNRCQVARIADMNHVLKETPADLAGQLHSYQVSTEPLAPGLVDAIVTFVRAIQW
jgi:pimeloyl-ACP methyl ester carboxylesterase